MSILNLFWCFISLSKTLINHIPRTAVNDQPVCLNNSKNNRAFINLFKDTFVKTEITKLFSKGFFFIWTEEQRLNFQLVFLIVCVNIFWRKTVHLDTVGLQTSSESENISDTPSKTFVKHLKRSDHSESHISVAVHCKYSLKDVPIKGCLYLIVSAFDLF